MCIFIEQIYNRPFGSNSFVIYTREKGTCIIIDPGTEDCGDLISFINKKKLIPEYIILTHEHLDHIWGVNKLKEKYNCKLICSKNCSEKIVAKKKNMSVFYDQVGFETLPADIYCEDIENLLIWDNKNVQFIPSKGHTDSSICILIGKNLFAGDTIIKNNKTVVRLPGGSESKLIESLSFLSDKFLYKQVMVHSGHGESFWFDEIKNHEFI